MKNLSITLKEDNRSIAVVYDYKVTDDNEIFHKIMEIVYTRNVSCTTAIDTNGNRCFHISGVNPKDVTNAYEDIKELN